MNLIDRLFRRQKSGTRASFGNNQAQPEAVSQRMDAAEISNILRSAESGDMREYFSLARDIISGHTHTQTEFGKRKLAVLAESQSCNPEDPDDAAQITLAKAIGTHFGLLPSWNSAMVHLLDSTLYPVSVLLKVYRPSTRPGWRYELEDLIPVPYHQLDFTTGTLLIKEVDTMGFPTGGTHFPDPLRYVVHRGHLLTSCPDTWGGPMRAIMFWWLFSANNRDWWARFLERFGSPFLEGTYDKSDDNSRVLLEHAFSAATRLFGIAVPDDASVKIHQANTSQGGDAFEQFHGTANREISKLILGQTLSAEGQNLGLGGGQASAQEGVRSDLRQFDANMLSFTVRTQILAPLCQINGWTVTPPIIAWGGDDVADLGTLSQVIERLSNAGIALTDEGIDSLAKRLALPLSRQSNPSALGLLSALASPTPGQRPAKPNLAAPLAATDRIATTAADPFAASMAAMLKPLSAIVSESTSLGDLERRLLRAVPTLSVKDASRLAESALVASSTNAASLSRES